jgi:hypothetical protein
MPAKKQILCVGADPTLLETRCAVLISTGYEARCGLYREAERILRTDEFDLIVVSAFLSDQQKERIVALAGAMPTIMLRGLTLAPELLRLVKQRLGETKDGCDGSDASVQC